MMGPGCAARVRRRDPPAPSVLSGVYVQHLGCVMLSSAPFIFPHSSSQSALGPAVFLLALLQALCTLYHHHIATNELGGWMTMP